MNIQKEIDWRTPSVQEPGVSVDRLKGELGKRLYDKETGRNDQYGLQQQVNWPTPRTSDTNGSRPGEIIEGKTGLIRVNGKDRIGAALSDIQPSGKLNPSWVEQLMGLPVGWTQLSSAKDQNRNRIDRLRLLGNGVVPATAAKALTILLGRVSFE